LWIFKGKIRKRDGKMVLSIEDIEQQCNDKARYGKRLK